MTNQEALEILKVHNEKCSGCDKLCDDLCKPAIETAISALEKQILQKLTRGMMSEQVKELREIAENRVNSLLVQKSLFGAADTIEALSAKLQAANMNRTKDNKKEYKHCEDCGNYIPAPDGLRGGKRGKCKKRPNSDLRSGCSKACKLFIEPMDPSTVDSGKKKGWHPISEYSRDKYDWVLVKYFYGEFECVPDVAEMRADGKWYSRSDMEIPFDVRYFFDVKELERL